jgi:hypothetical protein
MNLCTYCKDCVFSDLDNKQKHFIYCKKYKMYTEITKCCKSFVKKN